VGCLHGAAELAAFAASSREEANTPVIDQVGALPMFSNTFFSSYFYKECAYRAKVRYFEGIHINFFLLIGIYLHKDCFRPVQCLNLPVLGISDILVRIWIRGSIPLTNESRSNSGFCKHYFSLLKTFMRKGRIRIRTTDELLRIREAQNIQIWIPNIEMWNDPNALRKVFKSLTGL
jgi:hypothetical protein